MSTTLFVFAAACALVDWIAVWRNYRVLEYVFKPATIILLFAWFTQVTGLQGWAIWFGAGLIFSLLGDVLLMLPGNLFLASLGAFLAANLSYATGFTPNLPPINLLTILIAVVIAIVAVALYRLVAVAITAQGAGLGLRRGVMAYSIAITLMALSAVLTLFRLEWSIRAAYFAAVGGILFFTSAAILALNRFVRPIPRAPVLVIILYHAGQFALILGVALHFFYD